jgi:hypothetical protein
MASSGGLPPAAARSGGAGAPDDCGAALHSALAAAEAELLAARHASQTLSAVLPAVDTRALLRRVGELSAELSVLYDDMSAQQAGASGGAGASGVSRQRQRVEFSSLPHSLVVRVLAALPVDARLLCAEVCRTWRAAVLDRSLWLRVDLSRASGVTHAVTEGLLHVISKRAAGHLQALLLPLLLGAVPRTLLELLQANSASFRELETNAPFAQPAYFSLAEVEDMLHAAPQLEVMRLDVMAPMRDAARMLRNETPYGPMRVCLLKITEDTGYEPQPAEDEEDRVDDAELLAFAVAMRQHASLNGVWLQDVSLDTPAVLDAFIDAALARYFVHLDFDRCSLSPASVPALVRLLGSVLLVRLIVDNGGDHLLDAASAALLAGALRANTTLRCLQLDSVRL